MSYMLTWVILELTEILSLKSRFYWSLMDNQIKHFVTNICPCVKRKKPHIMKAAAMQSISTSETLEIITMDFLHLDKSSGGYQESNRHAQKTLAERNVSLERSYSEISLCVWLHDILLYWLFTILLTIWSYTKTLRRFDNIITGSWPWTNNPYILCWQM